MLTTRRYREGLKERLGRVPTRLDESIQGKQVIWLHAVSVGEVLAATRLINQLESLLNVGSPATPWRVMVSTTTRTGQALARQRFGGDRVFWFPLDFAWSVRSWMRALQPRLLVLMESELWPRLLSEASRWETPVAVVNARMSDRSFLRARRMRLLWRPVLNAVTVFLAQSDETRQRLEVLGVARERIEITGNLKFDIEPRKTPMLEALQARLGRSPVVIAGSLLDGEEDLLLREWAEIHRSVPGAVLLLAPRHPERFNTVAALVRRSFPLLLASRFLQPGNRADLGGRLEPFTVVLLDTVGDLAALYGLADVAFVGGSLVRKGGHNPLEPARVGVPVVMGPSFENFREIVTEMQAVGGLELVQNSVQLRQALVRLLRDRVEADLLGQRGKLVFQKMSGATARTVKALQLLLTQANSDPQASRL